MTIITKDPSVINPIRSQITMLVRANYSNPPNHGARIVGTVLNDPALTEQWLVTCFFFRVIFIQGNYIQF